MFEERRGINILCNSTGNKPGLEIKAPEEDKDVLTIIVVHHGTRYPARSERSLTLKVSKLRGRTAVSLGSCPDLHLGKEFGPGGLPRTGVTLRLQHGAV